MQRFFTTLFVIILIVFGCVRLSRYDNQTYKSLTYAKADVSALYKDKGNINETEWQVRAESIKAELDRMFEYEKDKNKNKDTTKQLKLLIEIYDTQVADPVWDKDKKELYTETMLLAFDGLIDSEKAKNKELF